MRDRNWRVVILLVVVVSVILTLGPTASLAADPNQAKKPLIAFSQSTMTHPWRVTETEDMKAWAEKLGVDLVWTDGQMDPAKQLKDCEDLLAKKPDILVLDPLSKDGLTPVYELAKKANVPLIVIDSVINAQPGTGTYFSLITKDFVEKGRNHARMAARALELKKGKPEGNVFYLDGMIGMSPLIDMLKGFDEEIAKYPGIKVVDRQSGQDVRGSAMKVIENALQRFPQGQLDFIVAANDEEAFGALDAIKEAGRTELIGMVTGQVGSKEELRRIILGEIFGTTSGTPYFGELTIKTALAYLKGDKIPPVQDIGSEVYKWDTPEDKAKTLDRYCWQVANNAYY